MTGGCYLDRQPWHWHTKDSDGCSGSGGDISFADGDFSRGDAIESAVLMQIMTERGRVDGSGWWGSSSFPFEIGSRLWLLRERHAVDGDAIIDADRYIREALDPLIGQGLASRYEVSARNIGGSLQISIDMFDDAGTSIYSNQIEWVF